MNDLYPNIFKNLTRNPITIVLLDNRKQTMVYDKTTKLSTLFQATCDLCYVDCDNIFGFAVLMDDYYAFLDLDTKVCKLNFKEFNKKSRENVLFMSWSSKCHSAQQSMDDTRRHSYGQNLQRDLNQKSQQSTSSTKSAPVSNHQRVTGDGIPCCDETPVIYFRIKSYVDIHCLRDRMTKALYFQQLMRNVLEYRLQCADEIYLQLGAYAIQAFYGDYQTFMSRNSDDQLSVTSTDSSSINTYSPSLVKLSRPLDKSQNFTKEQLSAGRYFEPYKFFPTWIIEKYSVEYLYKEIPKLHQGLADLSRFEAEFCFMRITSSQHSNFNMHLFPVRDQTISGGGYSSTSTSFLPSSNNDKQNGTKNDLNRLWLGLSPAGLEMHEMRNFDCLIHMSTLKWSDIDEVTQKAYRINIFVGCRTLKLHTNTKMQADHLFWLTRHMHMYQRKARLNATCTAETLENMERQKYREKYVYMDLEDLRLHGMPVVDKDDRRHEICTDEIVVQSVAKSMMPTFNTPAAQPRRTPSKARPMKMKDLMRMSNQNSDPATGANPALLQDSAKRPQYIKKMNPTGPTNTYTNAIQKVIKSPEITIKNNSGLPPHTRNQAAEDCEQQSHLSSMDDSDQNTSKTFDVFDESELASSINESEARSPGQFGLKHNGGRFISLSQNLAPFDDFSSSNFLSSSQDLLPPKEFREPVLPNTHITKSISFDIYDRVCQKLSKATPIKLSDQELIKANLCRSLPMIMGLCYEFNETQIIDYIKSSKLPKTFRKHQSKTSVGMKSWKSDILFNLHKFVEDGEEDSIMTSNNGSTVDIDSILVHSTSAIGRRNSLPRNQTTFGQSLFSSSSTLETENDHDSVDISSLSSFDYDYVTSSYSQFHKNTSAQSDSDSHVAAII